MSYIDKMKSKKDSIPALAVELMDAALSFTSYT